MVTEKNSDRRVEHIPFNALSSNHNCIEPHWDDKLVPYVATAPKLAFRTV